MVVIEIIGSEGKTPRFERPVMSVIRIGRALDNDVIIDDAYIDAHHAVVDVSDPENWRVTDLESKNGTFKGRHAIGNVNIESGDEFTIGKTSIRLFDQDHRVPAARSLADMEHRLLSFDSVATMVGLTFILAALPCVALYLNSTGKELKPDQFIVAATSMLGSSLLIAAFWSLIARLMRGESRFRVLFNLTMLLGLFSALLRPTISVISYNFPGAGLDQVANPLVSAILGGFYMYAVLLLSTRLSSPGSQITAVVLATVSIGIYALTQYSGKDNFQRYPHYDGAVYAPTFLMRRGETPAEFRQQLPDVFARADKLAEDGDSLLFNKK